MDNNSNNDFSKIEILDLSNPVTNSQIENLNIDENTEILDTSNLAQEKSIFSRHYSVPKDLLISNIMFASFIIVSFFAPYYLCSIKDENYSLVEMKYYTVFNIDFKNIKLFAIGCTFVLLSLITIIVIIYNYQVYKNGSNKKPCSYIIPLISNSCLVFVPKYISVVIENSKNSLSDGLFSEIGNFIGYYLFPISWVLLTLLLITSIILVIINKIKS